MISDYEEQDIKIRKKIVKTQDRNAEILFAETEWLLKKTKRKNDQQKEIIQYIFWSYHIIQIPLKNLQISLTNTQNNRKKFGYYTLCRIFVQRNVETTRS